MFSSSPSSSQSSSPPMPSPLSSSSPPQQQPSSDGSQVPHIRIVPHLDNMLSLHFKVMEHDVPDNVVIKIGRSTGKVDVKNRISFRSKVVSRGHAEIWTENGKFFLRDTESSSGTFLNRVRLSQAKILSQPFPLNDGDVVQLGVDYQGGTEEIYRCVKMRIEINRSWQQQANAFSTSTFQALRAFTSSPPLLPCSPSSPSFTSSEPSEPSELLSHFTEAPLPKTVMGPEDTSDCCICLNSIAPLQALFMSPCSHIFHYKCIRPLLQNHPGFSCPLCRTYADLDEDVSSEDDAMVPGSTCKAHASQVQNSSRDVEEERSRSRPRHAGPTVASTIAIMRTSLRAATGGSNSSFGNVANTNTPSLSLDDYPDLQIPSQPVNGLRNPRSLVKKIIRTCRDKRGRSPGAALAPGRPLSSDEDDFAVVPSPAESSSRNPIDNTFVFEETPFATPTEELQNPNEKIGKRYGGGGKGKERARLGRHDLLALEEDADAEGVEASVAIQTHESMT